MTKKKRNRKSNQTGGKSTTAKGRVVEQIVALMHRQEGVAVDTNVRLPALRGSRRKREIDVMITAKVAGYPVRIAIECKNEKHSIGVEKIDAFIGKLQDVGIPSQQGVYVSASGYTKGAIDRASEAGLRMLELDGLENTLPSEVRSAFQAMIYLLLEIQQVTVINHVEQTDNPINMLFFCDETGNVCGSLPDLIWDEWRSGKVSSSLGEYNLELTIPDEWHCVVDGQIVPVLSTKARVRVIGLAISLTSSVEQYTLVDASTKHVDKMHMHTAFDTTQTTYPVLTIHSESELQEFLERSDIVQIVGQVRLPRIRWGPVYWPPSERLMNQLAEIHRKNIAKGINEPPTRETLEALEGTDIRVIWEPIWTKHPAAE